MLAICNDTGTTNSNTNPSALCLEARWAARIIAKHFKESLRRCARPVEEPRASNMLLLERHLGNYDGSNIETRIPDLLIIGLSRRGAVL